MLSNLFDLPVYEWINNFVDSLTQKASNLTPRSRFQVDWLLKYKQLNICIYHFTKSCPEKRVPLICSEPWS